MMPAGISDFEKVRREGYYYVDKTNLICDLLEQNPTVTLITRPRRFGKTIAMDMLYNFFDIHKNSKEIFEGLNISEISILPFSYLLKKSMEELLIWLMPGLK